MTHSLGQERPEFHVPKRPAIESGVDSQAAAAETLEDQIQHRRQRTREALLLFANPEDRATITKRYRDELDGFDAVAAAAGESKVDAETMALIIALELEQLLEHPAFGQVSRNARREAELQLNAVKLRLDEQELIFREARERLTNENF